MYRGLIFAGSLIFSGCMLGGQAQAATFTQTLNYNASDQSIWGPGGSSAGFDFSNSINVNFPFGLPSANVGYSVTANSGSVSVNFLGEMEVDYETSIPSPGLTSLNLSYAGQFGTQCIPFLGNPCAIPLPTAGGKLVTDFGAKAQLLGIGPDFTLESSNEFFSELGTTFSASGSAPGIVQVPVVDIGVASAGVQLGLTQTSSFTANAIAGDLLYSLQGSSIVESTPFSLGDLGLNLDVDLTESGIWDFWFEDQTLANLFSTAFDLDLDLFAGTIAGCGTFGLSGCDTSGNITAFEIFMVDPFALNFNSITKLNGFSIEVGGALPSAVPIPAGIWLFGTALIGLVGFSRRKQSA